MADLQETFNELNNTPDTTYEFSTDDIQQNKFMAILSYISWLVLVPIFLAKQSKFARFHANQGLSLAICEIICWVVIGILDGLPLVGWIFSIVGWLLNLVFFAFAILGIINVLNERAKELPIVGSMRILK